MSKVLKFIVHFVMLCTAICVIALVVPQFLGVRTVIIDSSEKATNLPMGSVTYAIPIKTDEVSSGTPILVQEDSKTYRYNLISVNRENNTGTVIDTTTTAQENITVSVKNWVPKIVVTIPYIGYLMVATQSIEGLIIIGLVLLFLIILYVIAELWKKDPNEDDEYEDLQGDVRKVKTEKELKQEEKAREKRMNREDKEMLQNAKAKKKKEKKVQKEKRKKVRTGGFVDEVYEDDLDMEDAEENIPQTATDVQVATSEAHELLKKEIAAATADDPVDDTDVRVNDISPVDDGMEDDLQKAMEMFTDEDKEDDEIELIEAEIKKLAIPRYTSSQLASTARKMGDAPDIMRDSITNVTLLDYSDIIGGEEEPEE